MYCQCKCGCKLYGGLLRLCSRCGHSVLDRCCRAIEYEGPYVAVCYCHWCLDASIAAISATAATGATAATAATGATSATGATAAACATAIAATDACVSTDQPALER